MMACLRAKSVFSLCTPPEFSSAHMQTEFRPAGDRTMVVIGAWQQGTFTIDRHHG